MSSKTKNAKDLRKRREEGICKVCDCEEFRENVFHASHCRCTHRKSKHNLDATVDEKSMEVIDIESDIETIKELGQGANGIVYKAKHKPSGKTIALKHIKISSDSLVHELLKEISIMNNCESRNIVDFYGAYMDKKEVWIAMEYCSGGSLTKLMEKRGRAYTEEETSVITRNVLKALVYMHMSRRCHRDIKPENILLSGRGVPKLADFGISVQMGKGAQQMATLIGTPIFLAPEIITSDGYNTKVDVWALGISVIILLDGQPPYGDVDPVRAMFLISQSKEPPTLAHPKEWTKDLNDFVACCLHRDPSDRWSALELLSHPYLARHCHIKTVSTSVRHDKVQTIPSDPILAAQQEDSVSRRASSNHPKGNRKKSRTKDDGDDSPKKSTSENAANHHALENHVDERDRLTNSTSSHEDGKKKRDEADRKKKEKEEADAKRKKDEADRKKKEKDEADAKRKKEEKKEEERKRKEEEKERKRKEEERKRKEEEKERKRKEEEEEKRKEEEKKKKELESKKRKEESKNNQSVNSKKKRNNSDHNHNHSSNEDGSKTPVISERRRHRKTHDSMIDDHKKSKFVSEKLLISSESDRPRSSSTADMSPRGSSRPKSVAPRPTFTAPLPPRIAKENSSSNSTSSKRSKSTKETKEPKDDKEKERLEWEALLEQERLKQKRRDAKKNKDK